MIITKDFNSMIEMNKYIEDNNLKSKDICYMGNFLNVQGCCQVVSTTLGNPIPMSSMFSLQYENHIKPTTSCVD